MQQVLGGTGTWTAAKAHHNIAAHMGKKGDGGKNKGKQKVTAMNLPVSSCSAAGKVS